jgi:GntR family transcriptional regulator, transcriptional repressor for pyruvate dehydrogenase complex
MPPVRSTTATDPRAPTRSGRVTVADTVHDHLRDRILGGLYAPGSMLPPENDLAKSEGVNRQAVREALQRLRQVGVVEIVHGGGARVLDWRVNGSLSLLTEAMFRSDGPLDARVTESIFRLRLVTLVDGARLAAERRRDRVVERLRELVDQMRAPDANDAVLRGIFWYVVTAASGNVAYRLVYNTQVSIALKLPPESVAALLQGPEIIDVYEALADAIDNGDQDAAAVAADRILAPAVAVFAEMA